MLSTSIRVGTKEDKNCCPHMRLYIYIYKYVGEHVMFNNIRLLNMWHDVGDWKCKYKWGAKRGKGLYCTQCAQEETEERKRKRI